MQALRETGWNQVLGLMDAVGMLKAQGADLRQTSIYAGRQFLAPGDQALLTEVIWSLIVQGVLVPGLDDSNQGWPFLRLTEYGRQCVAEERFLPHDPDGYLREFRGSIPGVDSTVIEYVTESLQCYLHGLNKAAAVMLGGASEQTVLLLFDSYTDSIASPTSKQQFQMNMEKARTIFRKFELFNARLAASKPNMPKNLTENLDSLLRGVFDLIRNSRNDAGHPAIGGQINRDVVYSHLRLFVPYCQRIYSLISWFSTNNT
jgi:hypothetical protein